MPYSYKEGRYVHDFPTLNSGGRDIVMTHATDKRRAAMLDIERNLVTFAPSRSGKGATQIIPNLLHWTHNALVIDPKGEAAEATAEAREAMGQAVHVLDPFETCNVPARFRARLNLLDEIDPNDRNAFRQINAMADGMVMRHSTEAGHWDDGALKLVAGFIAHVLSAPNVERRNLVTMRQWLAEPNSESFGDLIDDMSENTACGRLAIGAAGKLTKTGTEAGHFLSGANGNTEWIDDPFMQTCLAESTFKLSDLKRKPMTVFLVLPFDALETYGRFLRLFVRMALYHMMQKMPDGSLKGERCLFILDEFFSLGKIGEIQKAVGGLPGFNLHLWPFLQDYNQLIELYSRDSAGTFFANADFAFFYGVNDPDTAEYVSKGAGRITESDLKIKPPPKPKEKQAPAPYASGLARFFNVTTTEYQQWAMGRIAPAPPNTNSSETWVNESNQRAYIRDTKNYNTARAYLDANRQATESAYIDAMNRYHHAQQTIGHPRLSAEEIYKITAKNEQRNVSDHALVLHGGDCFKVDLVAYFETPVKVPKRKPVKKATRKTDPFAHIKEDDCKYVEPEGDNVITGYFPDLEPKPVKKKATRKKAASKPKASTALTHYDIRRPPADDALIEFYVDRESEPLGDISKFKKVQVQAGKINMGVEKKLFGALRPRVARDGYAYCSYLRGSKDVHGWVRLSG